MSKSRENWWLVAGVISGVAAVGTAAITFFTTPTSKGKQPSTSTAPIRFTSTEIIVFAVIVGLIVFSICIALALYWRSKSRTAQIRQETERRQRDEVEKILERLRDRMSLPGLIELNRLMLTEYHSIATNQAQKSFRSAQRAMLGGFSWLIICFTAVILVSSLEGKIVSAALAPIGSILAGFLGRTYLLVYERSLVQLNQYYNQPLLNSYYLAAERLTTEMSAPTKDKLLERIVDQLLASAARLSEISARSSATLKKGRSTVASTKQVPTGEDDGHISSLVDQAG